MTLFAWLWPLLGSTGILGAAALFVGPLLKPYIEKAAQHSLDARLEGIKAQFRQEEERHKATLRSQDQRIDALRSGALSGLAGRQQLLSQRRILAVERIWAAVVALGPTKSVHSMAASIDLGETFKRSRGSGHEARNTRDFIKTMLSGFGFEKPSSADPSADLERLFVSAQSWSLFTVYRQMVQYPLMILFIASNDGARDVVLSKATPLVEAVKGVLPHQSTYLEKYGEGGLSYLLPQVEELLIASLTADLEGRQEDAVTIERASEILGKVDQAKTGLNVFQAGVTPLDLGPASTVPDPAA